MLNNRNCYRSLNQSVAVLKVPPLIMLLMSPLTKPPGQFCSLTATASRRITACSRRSTSASMTTVLEKQSKLLVCAKWPLWPVKAV